MTGTIDSLSIPAYDRSPSGDYIDYTILVQLLDAASSASSYSIQHRYSHFKRLHDQLAQLIGSPPPGAFPPSTSSALSSLFLFKSIPSRQQLDERRLGLEQWLKGLLLSRDTRWSSSHPFIAFLAPSSPPPTPSGSAATTTEKVSDWSSSSWLSVHQHLVALSRTLQSTLMQRNALVTAHDASVHAINAQAKSQLLDLVLRLEGLSKGLQQLAKEGMLQGEVQRRFRMVGELQGQVEQLGRIAKELPSSSASRTDTLSATSSSPQPPSAMRTALFQSTSAAQSKPTSRVLGFGASSNSSSPHETAQTRPLDNQGLLQLQQTYVTQQDSQLDALTAVLRRQRELGMMIGRELEEQDDLIDGNDSDVDRVKGKMKGAQKEVRRLGK